MATSKKSKSNDHCLALRGDLTIYHADELKSQLLSLLEKSGDVEVDLHDVNAVDSAGMQVLMAAKLEAQKRGTQLRLVGHSKAVLEAFELINVGGFFGDPLLLAGGQADSGRERV